MSAPPWNPVALLAALLVLPPAAVPGQPGAAPETVVIVVARDGHGSFTNVQEAVSAAPAGTATRPVVIRVKPGVYKGVVNVPREKPFIHMCGEDAERTVITAGLHANQVGADGAPIGTFRTPSVRIDADDFTAENLTFENTAGPVGQALAIRIDGDRAAFRRCRFLGWQDTVLANRGRHYFESCYIEGHADFIFGGATCWFERCRIHCLGDGYITAASTPETSAFGYVFSRCEITGRPGVRTYLGRPWRDFAAVVFLDTCMSDVIRPEGWHNWDRPESEKTARYAEHGTTGAGANATARVPWARRLSPDEAARITVNTVLGGPDEWDPRRAAGD